MAGASHLACVIGYPIAHSLSPAIHNAAFDALGLDWTFITIAVQPGAAADGIGLVRELGVEGVSVTMPHKQDVMPHLDGLAPSAEAVGAVNTIVREGARLVGHNTDGAGLVRFLRAEASFEPAGTDVTILGAGGAARAVAVALVNEGARVVVAARRLEQAEEVARLAPGIEPVEWSKARAADLVINATPARDGLPALRASVAVDMVYRVPKTAFLEAAEAGGARVFDGLGMLVHQAALAFEMWTGRTAPIEAMWAGARSPTAAQLGTNGDASPTGEPSA